MKQLKTQNGHHLAYENLQGKSPGIVFLGGFMSDMNGTKAIHFEEYCRKNERAYVRFDYFGHGQSSGTLEEGTIGQWLKDVLSILDELTEGPQCLIGSSLGGWLMALAAQRRSEKICALLGIASAPDFVEDFAHIDLRYLQDLEKNGVCYIPSQYGDLPYVITQKLIDDAVHFKVLDKKIEINCPIRLFHGLNDTDVAWEKSIALSKVFTCEDVQIQLVKSGDHRLATEAQLELYNHQLDQFF